MITFSYSFNNPEKKVSWIFLMNWLIGCLNYLNWVFNYGKAQLEWKMIKIYVDLWWGKKAYLWIPPNLHSILFHLVSYLLISLLLYIFIIYWDFQFSSVTQLCLTLCDPMDCSTPGLPVHHQHPESTHSNLFNQWCHPTISSSVVPFSCLQFVPASGSFPMILQHANWFASMKMVWR